MDDLSVVDAVATKHRMDVKLADHSFTVEGSEEKCDAQYERFLATIITLANIAGQQVQSSPKRLASDGPTKLTADPDHVDDGDVIERQWERAFKRKDSRLSLITLPSTSNQRADAIILLLYGFQTLFDQDAVSCIDLMDAAKQSGLRIDRVDRNLPTSYKQFYNRGGTGKGMRYSLNNVGLRRAQEILEQMYE
jgi:hypothetical protein